MSVCLILTVMSLSGVHNADNLTAWRLIPPESMYASAATGLLMY